MAQPRTIALDAMGGDFGPGVIIPGAAISLVRHPSLSFIFTGKESLIRAELEKHPELAARSRVIHTDTEIAMDDKPSQAVRRGKGTSMWLALEAVHKGEADVAVSAGNTGALMAMAKLILTSDAGHRAAGYRRAVADRHAELHRTRPRRQHRRQRTAAGRFRADGRRHGARPVSCREADGRPAQHRRRGDQGRRGGAGRRTPAQGGVGCRSTIAALSKATRSARVLSMSSSSKASPATSR